ncbi:MAG: hypothetical protein HC927_05170 [Deltaproteobacteria bacterium]|nr:hypothetical protein [Deltaproteobacteria bacterium]
MDEAIEQDELVELLAAGHRGADSPVHPRNVMNSFYWKPSFKLDTEREEKYLSGMLDTVVGPENYPGDLTTSDNWPGVAPGLTGMNNALSSKYCNQRALVDLERKIPILWIRGADDQIVSDSSFFDFGMLGQLGLVPGWPGEDVFPPQPMVGQMRAVLEVYRERGGRFVESVLEDCGHGPHIEREADVLDLLRDWLSE